jgi:hypothetical protein
MQYGPLSDLSTDKRPYSFSKLYKKALNTPLLLFLYLSMDDCLQNEEWGGYPFTQLNKGNAGWKLT